MKTKPVNPNFVPVAASDYPTIDAKRRYLAKLVRSGASGLAGGALTLEAIGLDNRLAGHGSGDIKYSEGEATVAFEQFLNLQNNLGAPGKIQ